MDEAEVRSILSTYRAGESDDARFETARGGRVRSRTRAMVAGGTGARSSDRAEA